MFFHIIRGLLFLPIRILYPIRVVGRKNLPKGKCVITANHTSNLDAVMMAVTMFKKQYYVAKIEMFKNRFLGFLFKALGAIPINREKPELSSIKTCLKVLKNNKKLVVFPEGTRNKSGNMDLKELKNGAAMFSIRSQSKIVPMWFKKKPRIFRFNTLYIGKAYEFEHLYGRKATSEETEAAGEMVAQKLLELRPIK